MIAVDIDDTLYSFTHIAREKCIEYGITLDDPAYTRVGYSSWVEWRSPDDIIGMDRWFAIIKACHEPEVLLAQPPYKGAAEVLWELVDAGYELTYITSRSPECHGATEEWLLANNFPSRGTTLLCEYFTSKARHIANCQYMIDDRPRNLVEFIYDYDWRYMYGVDDNQRLGFGLLGEYNRSLTDVPGVYLAPNWMLLREHLLKKGILPCPK